MTKSRKAGNLLLAAAAAALALAATSCPPRRTDGYRPPPAADPVAAFAANWAPLEVMSGAYRARFRYADGKRVPLTANVVVERGARLRVDLSSDRGSEAIVIIVPELINLVNLRDRYHVREENTPYNAGRMIGIYLPPEEVAAILSGRGFEPGRFSQVYAEPADGGGASLRAYHAGEALRVDAYVDAYGRLRSARYIDGRSDEPIVAVSYRGFRLDGESGIVWPGTTEIELALSGEQITLSALRVDVNPTGLDLDFIFLPRERGSRLRLDDVPPGPPLLYRSAREYVQ